MSDEEKKQIKFDGQSSKVSIFQAQVRLSSVDKDIFKPSPVKKTVRVKPNKKKN